MIPPSLYGLTLHQTYRYFQMYRGDSARMKTFVRDSLGAISQMDMLIGDGYYQVTITAYVLL